MRSSRRPSSTPAAWACGRLSLADRSRSPATLPQIYSGLSTHRRDPWVIVSDPPHQAFLRRGDTASAVRCSFWFGLILILRGKHARGGAWLGRAQHIVEDAALVARSGSTSGFHGGAGSRQRSGHLV